MTVEHCKRSVPAFTAVNLSKKTQNGGSNITSDEESEAIRQIIFNEGDVSNNLALLGYYNITDPKFIDEIRAVIHSDPEFNPRRGHNMFGFITEGVLLTTIATLGFLGNTLSVYVLIKPSVPGIFSNLLTALATFDALFLVSAILTFGLPALSVEYKDHVFLTIFPISYGLSHTFRVGSVYSTLSVTLERFFAIVFPFKDFDNVKRWLIPFTTCFAILYNIPKYFELQTAVDESTNQTVIVGTALRTNPHYRTFYVFWSKFLFIELFPYLLIVILNSFILVKIVKSSKFRKKIMRNGNNRNSVNHHVVLMESPPLSQQQQQQQQPNAPGGTNNGNAQSG